MHQLADAPLKMILKRYPHNPTHLFVDNQYYFITASTYKKLKVIHQRKSKQILLEIIIKFSTEYKYDIFGYVILDNHYHLLLQIKNSKDIPIFIRKTHSKSAVLIKKEFPQNSFSDGPFWYNYWDEVVKDEKDYFTKLNYIHSNPIKHGYTDKYEDYEFSSFKHYCDDVGFDEVYKLIMKYPIKKVKRDDF